MKHEATLELRPSTWKDAHRILKRKTFEPSEDKDGVIYTFTATFPDNIEVDIKVCNGDSPYVDPVIFDSGSEIYASEVVDDLRQPFMFEVDGNEYVVNLKVNRTKEFQKDCYSLFDNYFQKKATV